MASRTEEVDSVEDFNEMETEKYASICNLADAWYDLLSVIQVYCRLIQCLAAGGAILPILV